jgi:integrase/recombinase XerD
VSDQIQQLLARCEGAYSENTLRGYAADLRAFQGWCGTHGRTWFPAESQTVADFIEAERGHMLISSIKRRLCAITFIHRIENRPNPTIAPDVQLSLRRAVRAKPRRPHQVTGLTSEILGTILKACPATLRGKRDAALVAVGYDTLCRSAELAAMQMGHLQTAEDGTLSILIPLSKGDVAGDGRIAHLSPQSAALMHDWLTSAGIKTGPLFRAANNTRVSDRALDTCSIRRLIKSAAKRAGLDPQVAMGLSGHSMRVGAAQDMMTAGFDQLAIMQAGGWKSTNVVARYVENASTRALHERRWQFLSRDLAAG